MAIFTSPCDLFRRLFKGVRAGLVVGVLFFCAIGARAQSLDFPPPLELTAGAKAQGMAAVDQPEYWSAEDSSLSLPELWGKDNWVLGNIPNAKAGKWARFSLINHSDSTQHLLLFLGWHDIITFFSYDSTGKLISQHLGQMEGDGGGGRNILDRHQGILEVAAGDTAVCWLHYSSWVRFLKPQIYVQTRQESRQEQAMDYLNRRATARLHAASIAVTLFQLIFTLGLWFSTRKPAYLAYALYLLLIGLFIHLRYSEYVFWPVTLDLPPMVWLAIYKSLPFAGYLFYFRFASDFLQIPEKQPELVWWFRLGEWLCLIFVVTAFPLLFIPSLQIVVYSIISFSVFGIAVYLYTRIIPRKEPLVYLLTFGSAVFASGAIFTGIITILSAMGLIIPDYELDLFLIGMILELLIFSFALAVKFRQDEREKTLAQESLVKELQEKQQLSEKLQGMRNKVARDLHDDIGATLSSIVIYSELARAQPDPARRHALLGKIAEVSQEMSQSMRDTVWAIHPRHDSLDSFVARVEAFAASVLGSNGISFTLNTNLQGHDQSMGMELRQSLYLICKEALNNIAKHAQATAVKIQFDASDSEVLLEIEDNGIGMKPAVSEGGNGLKNMEARVQEWQGTMQCLAVLPKGLKLRFFIPLPAIGDATRPA